MDLTKAQAIERLRSKWHKDDYFKTLATTLKQVVASKKNKLKIINDTIKHFTINK